MMTLHCPPIYGDKYPAFNEDAYFVNVFNASKLNIKMQRIAQQIVTELESGDGCVLLKNTYTGDCINRSKSVLLNVCRHIGWPISQTPAVKFIEEVTFKASGCEASQKAGYRSRASMPMHTDRCDLNVLFCHRPALNGGHTRVVSSVKLYHTLKQHLSSFNPEVLDSYFPFNTHGENKTGEEDYYLSKLFYPSPDTTEFAAHYIRCFIDDPAPQTYPLSDSMIHLMDLIDTLSQREDVGVNINLCKGDILLLNSHTTLHAREAYVDNDSSRLLLRVWLSHPRSRALPADFLHKFKDLSAGSYRGGIWGNDKARRFYAEQFLKCQNTKTKEHAEPGD